jgi:hypothetical protein
MRPGCPQGTTGHDTQTGAMKVTVDDVVQFECRDVERGELYALPSLVAAGASDLRAVLMWASQCFTQHHTSGPPTRPSWSRASIRPAGRDDEVRR